MNDLTKDQWSALVVELAEQASHRWPGVSIEVRGTHIMAGIRGILTGDLRLEMGSDGEHLVPHVSIGSTTAYPSSLVAAQSHHQDAQLVLSVLFGIARQVHDIRVFSNGQCPCSHCGGRGTVAPNSGTPCTNCDGTGKV